ncbi:MAG: rhamnan synthesis F family protein [Roseiarcus sp.]
MRSSAYAWHVAQKLLSLTAGLLFVSPQGQKIRGWLARGAPPQPWPALRLAMVVHAYYPELLPEILACRSLLPNGTPLFVTVPPEKHGEAQRRLEGVADVRLFITPNRGRDIAPFLSLLNAGILEPFDAALKIHTKRSPHLLDGNIRRKLLLQLLCGEPRAARATASLFEDAEVGMVGWAASYRAAPGYWMTNEAAVASLARRMNAADSARLGFFEGSMFWFRPSALEPLRRLNLAPEDFEAEAGQTDGTLHHAVERCFTIAAWAGGFTVRNLRGRLLVGGDVARNRPEFISPTVAERAPDHLAG